MQKNTPLAAASCCLFIACFLGGCGQPEPIRSTAAPTPAAKAHGSPPAAPMAETQRRRIEERQRAAREEQRKQEEKKQRSRRFVGVKFLGFNDKGRVRVAMTNLTDQDIDDIRGGIHAEDKDGNNLAASGYTEAVPGSLFLPVGKTVEHLPFMSPRPELNKQLRANPESVRFWFAADEITYGDRSKEAELEK